MTYEENVRNAATLLSSEYHESNRPQGSYSIPYQEWTNKQKEVAIKLFQTTAHIVLSLQAQAFKMGYLMQWDGKEPQVGSLIEFDCEQEMFNRGLIPQKQNEDGF